MKTLELKVTKREILGKKVRFLRRQGITPVHLFGHGIESLALQCEAAKLNQVLAQAGKSTLISINLDKEKKARSVVVREAKKSSLTGELLHVDFYQVKMEEAVKVEVPVVLIGESPTLKSKGNMLLQELHTLHIECLPANILANVEMDISLLTEPGQAIRVKDIDLGQDVTIHNDPDLVVVKISSRHVEKIEEEVVAAEEAAKAPGVAPSPEEGS